MQGKSLRRALLITAALPLLYMADVSLNKAPLVTFVHQAEAIIGAPLSPVSAAGVARRTTARAMTATAAAQPVPVPQPQPVPAPPPPQPVTEPAQPAATPGPSAAPAGEAAVPRPADAPAIGTITSSLPEGCESEVRDGVEYQNCGGVLYRTAFQGNNLVYVVQ